VEQLKQEQESEKSLSDSAPPEHVSEHSVPIAVPALEALKLHFSSEGDRRLHARSETSLTDIEDVTYKVLRDSETREE